MIKIVKIEINRFRSIMKMTLNFEQNFNFKKL
jgi:predicted ATP-dependent endonuclease of OLD family